MSEEIGYQYLNTAFTGAINPALSGNSIFSFPSTDFGSAETLNQGEFK